MKQLGSKLADSVRQVKTQQAENDEVVVEEQEQVAQEDKTPKPIPVSSKPEAPLPLFPSKRVWPD